MNGSGAACAAPYSRPTRAVGFITTTTGRTVNGDTRPCVSSFNDINTTNRPSRTTRIGRYSISNTLRTAFRRKLLAIVATPLLLLGSASAATPLEPAVDADVLHYSEQFFSDATYTAKVGAGSGYCDGDYVWRWGYSTAHSQIVYRNDCP